MEVSNTALLESLKESVGMEVLQLIMRTYIQDSEDQCAQMAIHLREGDLHPLGRIAHSLKGSSGNLGLERAAHCAEKLQRACEAEIKPEAQELATELTQEIAAAIQKLYDFGA